jgi:hypothetical protein
MASFGATWVKAFGAQKVTPYVHIMVKHSYAYLKLYGSFRPWSQEGFEASHKRQKRYYMKTNFGGGKNGDPSSVFLQVLQKLYRIQYLQAKVNTSVAAAAGSKKVAATRVAEFRARERARAHVYKQYKCRALKKAAESDGMETD